MERPDGRSEIIKTSAGFAAAETKENQLMLVSIVVPCYNSEHTISDLVELTIQTLQNSYPDYGVEFVLVNDYSKDHTMDIIRSLCQKYSL